MSAPATVTEPMAWIGCLACHNAGNLVGHWYPATEAADVTVADLHAGTDVPYSDDEIAKASDDVKGKTEMEAVIAYLQVLGRALR